MARPPISEDPRLKRSRDQQKIREAQGLGDTVAQVIHAVGADKLAEAYTRLTGRPCNCDRRREALNKLWPYKGGVK